MTLLVVLFVAAVVVPVALGVAAYRFSHEPLGGPVRWGTAAGARLGPVGGAVAFLLVGYVVVVGVGLALGFVAKSLENSVDRPAFRWINPRVPANAEFTTLNNKLTMLGNGPIIELVVMLSCLILVFAYRRRWWLPLISIVGAFFVEKYVQRLLGHVVDRGHPPTTAGTYPSGGVDRILAVYGVVLLVAVMLLPTLSRRWRFGLWTGLTTAATVEAFTRVYLSKHWLTDALFALPVGIVMLIVNVGAVTALAYRQSDGSAKDGRNATAARATRDGMAVRGDRPLTETSAVPPVR